MDMWITWLIIIVLIVAAVGGGIWTYLRTRGLPPIIRWLVALAPLATAVLIYVLLSILAAAPIFDWNGAKIAPAIGMLKGYPLYPDPRTGLMTAWIYGPVPALLMLPAAMWSRPTWVIIAGAVINFLVCMAPTLWLHLGATSAPIGIDRARNRRGWRWFAPMAFVGFTWMTLDHESMRRAGLMIAPDGPTVGMLSFSIALLAASRTATSRANRRRGLLFTALSAVFVILACWCKQSAVTALLAAPLYLLIADGWMAAATYAACLAIAGVVISAIFLLSFGASNMWFQMVTLSAHHPWRDLERGRVTLLFEAIMLLLNELAPTLLLLGIVLAAQRYLFRVRPDRGTNRPSASSIKRWFNDNVWIVMPITATLLLPAALLGYLKIGGYVNNFSLVHWFIAAAATVCLVRTYRTPDEVVGDAVEANAITAERFAALRPLFALATASLLLLVHTPGMLLTKRKPETMFLQIALVKSNPHETVYDLAVLRPGSVYYPWNVLSTLLAEGKYYHFEWGIYDRLATPPEAGLRPSGEQIVNHLPEKMEYVAYGPMRQSQNAMMLFPPPPAGYAPQELPGFIVYPERRPPASLAAELAARVRLFDDGKAILDAKRNAGVGK